MAIQLAFPPPQRRRQQLQPFPSLFFISPIPLAAHGVRVVPSMRGVIVFFYHSTAPMHSANEEETRKKKEDLNHLVILLRVHVPQGRDHRSQQRLQHVVRRSIPCRRTNARRISKVDAVH
jgi:hypothetical protein